MADQSETEQVSISNIDQSKSAFDDNEPPSQSAIDDPSVTDNTVVQGADKEDKGD